jgi:hypothetical protein
MTSEFLVNRITLTRYQPGGTQNIAVVPVIMTSIHIQIDSFCERYFIASPLGIIPIHENKIYN